MKKTFVVTIDVKRGHEVASLSTLRSAIHFTDPTNESYKSVDVKEVTKNGNR